MEAMVRSFPNQDISNFSCCEQHEEVEYDDLDLESTHLRNTESVPIFIRKRRIKDKEKEISLKKDLLDFDVTIEDKGIPRFNFDTERMEVVKFSSDLLLNLDLKIFYKIFGTYKKIENFEDSITYDKELGNKFRSLVLRKKGFLEEESNYLKVSENFIREESNVTTLRNSRVILFWRGLYLKDIDIKRILTLGLSYLIGVISKAELINEISFIIPKGAYEVSFNHKENCFMIIGIEAPIFNY